MSTHGQQLHATAEGQIAELIALVSTLDDARLRLPCAGREKLGDGTVAACVQHTAHNYALIADFVRASDRMSRADSPTERDAHRVPQFPHAVGHGPGAAPDAEHGAGAGEHEHRYTAANIDLVAVGKQLSVSRETLGRLLELTDSQLDATPPKDRFRFCDGQRTLEQVLAGLLKHQSHHIGAVRAAIP
jgi:hypothetical protein